jgi:hypothetical protein
MQKKDLFISNNGSLKNFNFEALNFAQIKSWEKVMQEEKGQ